MNRDEYLKQLEKYVRCLPKEDFEKTMAHFEEYFDEVGPEREQDAIAELGTPKEAAYELLSQMLETGEKKMEPNVTDSEPDNEKMNEASSAGKRHYEIKSKKKLSTGAMILIAILAIFASPVAIPVSITAVLLILTLIAAAMSMIIAAFLVCIAIILVSGKLIVAGLFTTVVSVPGAISMVGAGIIGLGTGILGLLALWTGFKFMGQLIRAFARWLTKKGEKSNEKME